MGKAEFPTAHGRHASDVLFFKITLEGPLKNALFVNGMSV